MEVGMSTVAESLIVDTSISELALADIAVAVNGNSSNGFPDDPSNNINGNLKSSMASRCDPPEYKTTTASLTTELLVYDGVRDTMDVDEEINATEEAGCAAVESLTVENSANMQGNYNDNIAAIVNTSIWYSDNATDNNKDNGELLWPAHHNASKNSLTSLNPTLVAYEPPPEEDRDSKVLSSDDDSTLRIDRPCEPGPPCDSDLAVKNDVDIIDDPRGLETCCIIISCDKEARRIFQNCDPKYRRIRNHHYHFCCFNCIDFIQFRDRELRRVFHGICGFWFRRFTSRWYSGG
jgi:hypothetical protein